MNENIFHTLLYTFIKENFHTEPTTLEKSGIKVFRSSQVNLRTINESLEYRIITTGELHYLHELVNYPEKKVGANPKSLENQTLQVGDILIATRARFKTIGLVTKKNLEAGISTVAMNGMIIIRTGDENLSSFIKYYLELPEVQDSINYDSRASKDGKRIIPIELISELQFPDILKINFQTFKKHNDYFKLITSKTQSINVALNMLVDLQLAGACNMDIDNDNSYSLDKWRKVDESLNSLSRSLTSIFNSAKLPAGYANDVDVIMAIWEPLVEFSNKPTSNQTNGKI